MRILAPQGTLLTGSGSSLSPPVKPEDERYDDWTHFEANEFTTNANNDTAVAPSNTIRFFNQSFVGAQLRTANGTVAYWEEAAGSNIRAIKADGK